MPRSRRRSSSKYLDQQRSIGVMEVPAPSVQAPAETWLWTAFYDDGSSLSEFDAADGTEHGFGDIDLTRLREFCLLPVDATQPAFSVLIDPAKGQRPIFFRRRASNWLLSGEGAETLLTCIGRQETVHGTNVSTYVFFDERGHVLIADNRNPLD